MKISVMIYQYIVILSTSTKKKGEQVLTNLVIYESSVVLIMISSPVSTKGGAYELQQITIIQIT